MKNWVSDLIFVMFVLITIIVGILFDKEAALITGTVLTFAFIGIEIWFAPKEEGGIGNNHDSDAI